MAAGYLPLCDDHNPEPVLTAQNNRVRANERTLVGAFQESRRDMDSPSVLQREDGGFIEARDFLRWLSQACDETSPMPFPSEIATRVAEVKPLRLTEALDPWFGAQLCDLPEVLCLRVDPPPIPWLPWDDLCPAGRRIVAQHLDQQHDPATEAGHDRLTPTMSGEAQCRAWLEGLMRDGSPEHAKREYQEQATQNFRVSTRGFNRAWSNAVISTNNTSWTHPGRKSKRRIDTPK